MSSSTSGAAKSNIATSISTLRGANATARFGESDDEGRYLANRAAEIEGNSYERPSGNNHEETFEYQIVASTPDFLNGTESLPVQVNIPENLKKWSRKAAFKSATVDVEHLTSKGFSMRICDTRTASFRACICTEPKKEETFEVEAGDVEDPFEGKDLNALERLVAAGATPDSLKMGEVTTSTGDTYIGVLLSPKVAEAYEMLLEVLGESENESVRALTENDRVKRNLIMVGDTPFVMGLRADVWEIMVEKMMMARKDLQVRNKPKSEARTPYNTRAHFANYTKTKGGLTTSAELGFSRADEILVTGAITYVGPDPEEV